MIYKHITQLIGNTPTLYLETIKKNDIYLKLELFNPGGSIKDRIAFEMIEHLLTTNKINKDTKIVEATSGNTGIGLAFVLASYGMSLTLCMPENMSKERRDILSAYGAKLILTPAKEGMKGSIKKALELEKEGYYYIDQFNNKNNELAHIRTTAKEIIKDLNDDLDYIVAGVGTSGTISGLAKAIKTFNKKVKIIAVEPFESRVLEKGKSGPHGISGIGAGFLPPLYNKDIIDGIIPIKTSVAQETSNELTKKGIFIGISSGAAVAAARILTKSCKDKKILVICPDGGAKYISTGIYNND